MDCIRSTYIGDPIYSDTEVYLEHISLNKYLHSHALKHEYGSK